MAEWLPLGQAAQEVGISQPKLTRMVKQGRIRAEKDLRDERITLIDMEQLRAMFPPRKR